MDKMDIDSEDIKAKSLDLTPELAAEMVFNGEIGLVEAILLLPGSKEVTKPRN